MPDRVEQRKTLLSVPHEEHLVRGIDLDGGGTGGTVMSAAWAAFGLEFRAVQAPCPG